MNTEYVCDIEGNYWFKEAATGNTYSTQQLWLLELLCAEGYWIAIEPPSVTAAGKKVAPKE